MNRCFDILIRSAQVIDGTGADRYEADVGICGGKIVQIGELGACEAKETVCAEGLVLTPGFIDAHSHADCTLLLYPQAESCVMQGVTTVVGGNCGYSPAPIGDKWVAEFWEYDLWDEVCPSVYQLFGGQTIQPIEKVKKVFHDRLGYDVNWHSFGEFLQELQNRKIAVNLVPLVGHGQIRATVMGTDFAREATAEELEQMRGYTREAMEAGAFGFSSGLSYLPGVFAPPAELEELAKIVQSYGGIYATHFNRADLKTGKGTKIKGIEEAIAIAKSTGIQVEISHIFSGYDMKPDAPASVAEELARKTADVINQAAADGVKIAFDVIPNVDGGIAHMPNLSVLLHAWLKESGSMAQFLDNLAAQDYRDAIRAFIEAGKWYMLDPVSDPAWDRKTIVIRCRREKYEGKSLSEIAAKKGQDSLNTVFALLRDDPDTKIRQIIPELREEAVKVFINDERSLIGSDSFALDDAGPYGKRWPVFAVPHPNTYGAFIRYLCDYPQRLEDAIHKITGYSAQWFGLQNRGFIREGYQADLVLLDRKALDPMLDYTQPCRYPKGIQTVIVNGQMTVKDGKHTGARAGCVLKKQKGEGEHE